MNRWHDIDGWLTPAEGAELQMLAFGRDVLEIGAWHGRSTVAMALTARRVFTVDHFRGDGYTNGSPKFATFHASLARHNVERAVTILVGDQRDILPRLRGDFSLVFYDADHTGETTAYALEWVREQVPNAIVAVHDYTDAYDHYRDAKHAIDRLAKSLGREIRLVDTLAVLEPPAGLLFPRRTKDAVNDNANDGPKQRDIK